VPERSIRAPALSQERYLQEHRRDICPGCKLWVLWYRDEEGKPVYGCEIGKIPDRGQCDSREEEQ